MPLRSLEGFVVGITADRRADEQAELLERRGAKTMLGPAISTEYLHDDDALRQATLRLIATPPTHLLATTGIGIRAWFDAAESWDLADALCRSLGETVILARGPKVAAALQRVGLTPTRHSATERIAGLLDELEADLAGARVAFQCYGAQDPATVALIEARGASVCEVPVYRYGPPNDTTPALRLVDAVCGGEVDAVTFTSAPAILNLVQLAESEGRLERLVGAFNGNVLAACIGPVCAEAATEAGVATPTFPTLGRLGLLVRLVAETLEGRRRELRLDGRPVVVQGRAVDLDGTVANLTGRERSVLDVLVAARGAVVSRPTLLREVWDADADPHVLEATIGRLRARLGDAGRAVVAIRGRGYRLVM